MIEPKFFYDELLKNGTEFFTGVPDSLLKDFCAYLTDNANPSSYIIAANEGCSIGQAIGNYLATEKIPLVFMQNSGLGNTVNPILSLASSDVYSIPMILLIGWRGMPGVKDEPQHKMQGKVTLSLLDAMKIPYVIMAGNQDELKSQIEFCYSTLKQNSSPFAFVVKKGTFYSYGLQNIKNDISNISREDAIKTIIENINENSCIVSTTGMISRELFELREKHKLGHEKDFLTVGGMGHASQIALGIAISKPEKNVVCLEGDGAVIMHTGGLSSIGTRNLKNFIHIVLNNAAHDSVGGQPTVADKIDLCKIADAVGYKKTLSVNTILDLKNFLQEIKDKKNLVEMSPVFLEVKVKKGARKDLGRPTTTPIQNKEALMEFLKEEKND